jgi:beta-lactamase class C
MKFLNQIVLSFYIFFLSIEGVLAGGESIDEIISEFKINFEHELKENDIPGGAYAVIQGGKVVSIGGYGVRSIGSSDPVDENTVFRLASVSKTFAAGLTAQLVAENKFSWDDRIVDFIPEFRFKSKTFSSGLSVKHILSQSSGLVHNAYDNLVEANYSIDKIIPKFDEINPGCPAGQCYGYQNVLYSLIQPIIEKSTKDSYENLMSNHIFGPLNMKQSSLGLEPFLQNENHAEPHVFTRNGWVKTKVQPSYYRILPAAGVNASVADMSKWMMAQMGYFPDVYSPDVVDTITTKRIRTGKEMGKRDWKPFLKNAHYGYGWRIYQIGNEELIYHGGSVAGFRSEVAYSKERDIALVILLNAETRVGSKLNTNFWEQVYKPTSDVRTVRTNAPKIIRASSSQNYVPRDKPGITPTSQ